MSQFGSTLSARHCAELERRGLDLEICTQVGMVSSGEGLGMLYGPGQSESDWVYVKTRSEIGPGKKGKVFATPEGVPHDWFFNHAAIHHGSADRTLVITTGEFDAVTAMQVGYQFAVSLPDGDSSVNIISKHLDEVSAFGRIILSFDGDAPGQKALTKALSMLPSHKTDVVRYPSGLKDLNDVWNMGESGPTEARRILDQSQSFNSGCFTLLADMPEPEPYETYPCGVVAMNKHLRWVDGEMCFVVGPYGSGKSHFMKQIAVAFAEANSEEQVGNIAFTVFEEDYSRQLRRDLLSMSGGDDAVIRRFYRLHPPPKTTRSIDLWMTLISEAKRRHNIRTFFLDPWNRLDHILLRGESETQYASEVLTALSDFVYSENIRIVIAAHVSGKVFERGKVRDFSLADVHGSIHFGNRADRGICVWRSREFGRDNMCVKFDKTKDEFIRGSLGRQAYKIDPASRRMVFDLRSTDLLNGNDDGSFTGEGEF